MDSHFTTAKQDENCHSDYCGRSDIPFGADYLLYASPATGSYVRVCMNCVHRTLNTIPLTYVYECEAVHDYMDDLTCLSGGAA